MSTKESFSRSQEGAWTWKLEMPEVEQRGPCSNTPGKIWQRWRNSLVDCAAASAKSSGWTRTVHSGFRNPKGPVSLFILVIGWWTRTDRWLPLTQRTSRLSTSCASAGARQPKRGDHDWSPRFFLCFLFQLFLRSLHVFTSFGIYYNSIIFINEQGSIDNRSSF